MTDALYPALIVEHDRNPRHRGELAGATHRATVDNPLCGDVVTVELVVDAGQIRAIACHGDGCALARAAASLMAVRLTDAPVAAVADLVASFAQLVSAPLDAPVPDALGDLAAFRGLRAVRSRRGCATLPFRALTAALAGAWPPSRHAGGRGA